MKVGSDAGAHTYTAGKIALTTDDQTTKTPTNDNYVPRVCHLQVLRLLLVLLVPVAHPLAAHPLAAHHPAGHRPGSPQPPPQASLLERRQAHPRVHPQEKPQSRQAQGSDRQKCNSNNNMNDKNGSRNSLLLPVVRRESRKQATAVVPVKLLPLWSRLLWQEWRRVKRRAREGRRRQLLAKSVGQQARPL